MENKAREITLVPISQLKPRPNNRNKHSKEQIDELAKHFAYQGFRNPLIVSNQSGNIVCGHGRFLAAKKAGLKELPVIFQDFDSPEKEYAYHIADNGLSLWAELDLSGINLDLPDLGPDFNIDMLGIKDFKLDPSEIGQCNEDEIPEKVEPKSNLGDLFQLGNHRLLCGDSMDVLQVENLMNGEKADMVFTSPPYNQKLDSFKPSGMQSESPNWVNKMGASYFDSLPEDEYQQKQIDLLGLIYAFTTDTASVFYNHKIRYRDKQILTPYEWLSKSAFKIRQEIIWDRAGSITLNARMFMPCDERIYWLTKGDFLFNDTTEIKSWSSVWRIAPKNEIKGVSAPFPNELPQRGIEACSQKNNLIFEPYCGTGTTLIAAEKLERKCYALELNPYYCDVIIARWEKFTGQKSVQLN